MFLRLIIRRTLSRFESMGVTGRSIGMQLSWMHYIRGIYGY